MGATNLLCRQNNAYVKKKAGEDDFTGFLEMEGVLTILSCGRDRIRTCDPLLADNRLAGGPIRPLWHPPKQTWVKTAEGVGFEPTVTRSATLVFKTNALNRSAILP